jgi:hypothetical protein
MSDALSLAAWTAMQTALLAQISTGDAATLELYDAEDTLLASLDLDLAAAAISGTTADLTIPIAAREDAAPAGGEADYALIRNGTPASVVRLPCKAGATADPGWCVMTTLTILIGQPVEAASVVLAAGNLI